MPDEAPVPDDLPPDDETSEDMVAYLDGELDDVESRAIETRLAGDDAARRKIESFKKTYDLLDYLPTTEPSPSFASRTLTQLSLAAPVGAPSHPAAPVAAATSGFVIPPPAPRRVGRFLAGWAFALLATGALGYFGHLLARPHLETADPTKRTSEQVRLLERLPLLLGVDDLPFAQQLEAPDLFGDPNAEEGTHPMPVDTLTSTELERLENVFKTYPLARQQQLRKLDEDIASLDAPAQTRLLASLDRYAIWLDRLPDSYRKEVLGAPAPFERVEAIRIVKARQWREGLPASVRERIQNAEGAQRDQLVADIRQQDARRRNTWEIAKREWANIRTDRRPWPFDNDELTRQVNEYVDNVLRPRLTSNERAELDAHRRDLAQGGDWFKWYLYGNNLIRLSDQHPMLPEPASGKLVKAIGDLPLEFLQLLRKKSGPGRRQLAQHPSAGKWPDFAEVVVRESHELKVPLPAGLVFGPSKPDDYQPAVKAFLEAELGSKMSAAEKADLKRQESAPWPDHSRRMLELARKYDLAVPGVTPPGPPSKWDQIYRNRPGKK
ncbi:MAG: hypothetical protein JNK93_09555 [Planctomycetia bacterium]|nr:hypothetical protein [Planctomycetia bacterium]